jgi:hypothetical protein
MKMNRRSILIYTAGPYSPYTDYENGPHAIAENIAVAKLMSIRLWEEGFTVICPHLNTFHFEEICRCQYEDYLAGDLRILARCDVLLMLPNWQRSSGSIREREFARSLNLPVYFNPNELLKDYPWMKS